MKAVVFTLGCKVNSCESAVLLTLLKEKGYDVWSVGKIIDIFAEKGITEYVRTANNEEGINQTISLMKKDFNGLKEVHLPFSISNVENFVPVR